MRRNNRNIIGKDSGTCSFGMLRGVSLSKPHFVVFPIQHLGEQVAGLVWDAGDWKGAAVQEDGRGDSMGVCSPVAYRHTIYSESSRTLVVGRLGTRPTSHCAVNGGRGEASPTTPPSIGNNTDSQNIFFSSISLQSSRTGFHHVCYLFIARSFPPRGRTSRRSNDDAE